MKTRFRRSSRLRVTHLFSSSADSRRVAARQMAFERLEDRRMLEGATLVWLSFDSSVAGTIEDKNGLGTGFTHRLPLTGGALPAHDSNLALGDGLLAIKATKSHLHRGGRNLSVIEAPGVFLQDMGEADLTVSAVFRDIDLRTWSDQLQVYVGASANRNVRAGIHMGTSGRQYILSDNQGFEDGWGENPYSGTEGDIQNGDDIEVSLMLRDGKWGMSWHNLTQSKTGSSPLYDAPWLDGYQLYAGIYYGSPRSSSSATLPTSYVDEFEVTSNTDTTTVHYVIAAMGDSYASGEGNPVTPGLIIPLVHPLPPLVIPPTWLTEGVSPDKNFANLMIRTTGDDDVGNNASYHRSPYAAPVLFAQTYARKRPHSSVDLVFAPQSGATMTTVEDNGIWTGAPIQVGQISDLMKDLPGSQIDVLTISFGGNDIGFDRIIKAMLLANMLPEASRNTFRDEHLLPAVNTGKGWADVRKELYLAEEVKTAKALLHWFMTVTPLPSILTGLGLDVAAWGWKEFVDWIVDGSHLTGLENLESKYDDLNNQIQAELNPKEVFITEYPVPYLDKKGNEVALNLIWKLGISVDEAKWIDEKIAEPLNIAVKNAADSNGWTLVTEIKEAFQGHPYRDGDSQCWFRTLWESLLFQHDFSGTLHPNKLGQDLIAAKLYTAITGLSQDTQPTVVTTLKSHADLHIFDPLGRHLGVNRITGQLEDQIPGGMLRYYLDANQDGIYEPSEEQHPTDYRDIPTDWVQVATLPQLLAGDYQMELIGTSNGPFELIVEGSQSDASVPGEEFSGTISVGDRLLTSTTVTGVDGSLTLLFTPLVSMPTMQINPQYPQRMVVTPGTTATMNVSVSEIGGRMRLNGVTIQASDLIGPWGTIPGSSVTFSSNNFDLAAGSTQSITVSCDIPADFRGIADGYLIVDSGDGGSQTLDLRLKFESLNVSPLEVTPRFSRDGIVEVNASFLDLDGFAAHTVVVDWGDGGLPEPIPVDETGGFGMIAAGHVYAEVGNYTFTVTVTDDAGASVSATAPVDVGNVQPVAGPDSYDAVENLVLEVTAVTGVLANDRDANEDTLIAVLVEGPRHGVLVLAEDGSFTYTPSANFNREDSFMYQASDGLSTSDPVRVTITVQTAYPWHNGLNPFDINDDSRVTPFDALLIINAINRGERGKLPLDRARPLSMPFYDVSRDGSLYPIDVLRVINRLNRPSGAEGEGERSTLAAPAQRADSPVGEESLSPMACIRQFFASSHSPEDRRRISPSSSALVASEPDQDGESDLLWSDPIQSLLTAGTPERWRTDLLFRTSRGASDLDDLLSEIADEVATAWSGGSLPG